MLWLWLGLLIALSLIPLPTNAQEFSYKLEGKIIEQPTYRFLTDDHLLNPDGDILKFPEWTNRFYGDISLDLYYRRLKFISKFRPTIYSEEGETNIKNSVDDAYLDMEFGKGFFIYVGKKNVRHGVGLGSNPTDFLGEGKEVDRTKREEERRLEREGNYLIGIDTFYENITLSTIFAPSISGLHQKRDRFLLKADISVESINTDMSLHYFNASIPGIGFNISSTISNELVLYTETAFRWGSDRKAVKLIQENIPDIYEISDCDDNHRVFPHVVIGGHYTFEDKTNIICEYIYNGSGYNDKEWDNLMEFIKYSYNGYKSGFFRELMELNLLQANSLMTFGKLRRNYIFTRISNPDIFGKIDGASVFLINLDDGSLLINPSLDYGVSKNTTIGFSGFIFSGKSDTEFGMTHWKGEIAMIYKYFF